MPLQAIIFDFDGVIADSEPLHLRAAQEVLAEQGLSLGEADYYERYLGFDDAGMFRAIGGDSGVEMDERTLASLIERKSRRMQQMLREGRVIFPGAAEAIRRFGAEVPLAIASGALGPEIDLVLRGAGLRDCFEAIVAAGDVARGKPAPDAYLRALALLDATGPSADGPIAPARCVAIEDSRWGLEAARAAGLRVVAVTHTYSATEIGPADLVVADLASLTIEALRAVCESGKPKGLHHR